MKKYILMLIMTLGMIVSAQAQRVIVTIGTPMVHTHYVEYHQHCVPPPPCHAPRYYYAPIEHHHHHHAHSVRPMPHHHHHR